MKGDWPPAASGDYHAAAAALQGASGLHATAGDFSHAYGTAAAAAAAHHYSNMAGWYINPFIFTSIPQWAKFRKIVHLCIIFLKHFGTTFCLLPRGRISYFYDIMSTF